MIRIVIIASAVLVALAVARVLLDASPAGPRALACEAMLQDARERLTEVDCRAPLNPRLPFGGMGLWRATYCPGSQP
jgi:hypothetical protein